VQVLINTANAIAAGAPVGVAILIADHAANSMATKAFNPGNPFLVSGVLNFFGQKLIHESLDVPKSPIIKARNLI